VDRPTGVRGEVIGCKADWMDSLTTLNFPSLTEETEYMTTKKAKSSVMKSA
jgi:hypothetical protein